jgi:hypothetical protein
VTRQLHAAAVLARLEAAPPVTPVMVVHDGKVPDAADPGANPPYAVVRFSFRKLTATESPASTSLTFDSVTYQVEVTVHSVGKDARATRGVAMRAESQLLNWTPTVTGRTCTPMRQISNDTLPPNEAMGVPVEEQVDVYTFRSQPA